ncbi:MAG: tetratricopeptide repeat protein [Myxococcales bacterium]|nr:tetratricopeptide repeat protein [Myxococcales bacterium]
MADKDSSSRKEPSDLFKVEHGTPSIAPVNKIVLPPAEALKRRIRRFIAAGIAALIFFFIVHTVLGWIHEARLASSLDEVINDASPDVIDGALSLLRDDPNGSVRARLLATAGLGGDLDKLTRAEALLAESAQQNDPDQRIARIYAFLAEGDPRAAHAEAERPAKYSDQADAFLLGRAWTAIARGQWRQALPDAEQVVDARPGAPEPLALLARIKARTENPEAALATLDGANTQTAATKIVRAQIVGLLQDNASEALGLVEEVRSDSDASALHKAWAELIEGVLAYRQGAVGAAFEHARAAAKPKLLADETLIVGTARLLLALGRTSDAKEVLKRLSSGPSADLSTRAHVIAWWYAQTGDRRAGLATLSGAGFGPEKEAQPAFRALVIAELLSDSPRAAERSRATALYKQAASDSQWGVAASNGLASSLVEDGSSEEAIAVLEAGLAAAPNHLGLVDTASQAYLDAGRLSEAEKVTSAALAAFDGEGWAHGSHARVLLAKGDAANAVAELDRAVELSPGDASLYALRGDATREVGSNDDAQAAYEKALALDPAQPRALSGFATLLIDTGSFDRAAEIIKQMDDAKVRDLRADEQRVRYLVLTGAGQRGMSTMRNAISRHPKNVALRLAGARVALQAEDYVRAGTYFQQARRNGADPRLADTALALAQLYGRRKLGAENSLERALEAVDAEGNRLTASPQVQVWELVVRARLALADEKRGLAVRYAGQALQIMPDDADVHLLRADIEEDRERSPEAPLRKAANAKLSMPVAAGRLAVLLGPTEEGCEMATRYLESNRSGKYASRARDLKRQCQ